MKKRFIMGLIACAMILLVACGKEKGKSEGSCGRRICRSFGRFA